MRWGENFMSSQIMTPSFLLKSLCGKLSNPWTIRGGNMRKSSRCCRPICLFRHDEAVMYGDQMFFTVTLMQDDAFLRESLGY